MVDVADVEVVVSHHERAVVRVGDVFLKIETNPDKSQRERAAMTAAPVPTPEDLWHQPPVLALRAVAGTPLDAGSPSAACNGTDVDRNVIRGWWALRRLASVRWMVEHGFDAGGDIATLRHSP